MDRDERNVAAKQHKIFLISLADAIVNPRTEKESKLGPTAHRRIAGNSPVMVHFKDAPENKEKLK